MAWDTGSIDRAAPVGKRQFGVRNGCLGLLLGLGVGGGEKLSLYVQFQLVRCTVCSKCSGHFFLVSTFDSAEVVHPSMES